MGNKNHLTGFRKRFTVTCLKPFSKVLVDFGPGTAGAGFGIYTIASVFAIVGVRREKAKKF